MIVSLPGVVGGAVGVAFKLPSDVVRVSELDLDPTDPVLIRGSKLSSSPRSMSGTSSASPSHPATVARADWVLGT